MFEIQKDSEIKELIKKTREYLDYVERHINNVDKAWLVLQEKCTDMQFIYDGVLRTKINESIKKHDMSKLSKEEFTQYRQFFYPTKYEDKNKDDFNSALENHLKENMHHWQTWTSKKPYNTYESQVFLIENIIDWVAMGYEFNNTAKEYYEKNKDKINIPNWALDIMYDVFKRIY